MKSNSDNRPPALLPLGDGTYHFNYNIQEVQVEQMDSEETRTAYDYDAVHVSDSSYGAIASAMIAERYSLVEELALHRQRDVKVVEFQEYNDYCEQCKQIVKEALGINS